MTALPRWICVFTDYPGLHRTMISKSGLIGNKLLRRQRLQPVNEVEGFAWGQLVGAGIAQQGFGGGCWGRGLGAAAGGAEERQVVGEAREGAALFAFFEHREHLLRARRYGLRQAGELGDMDAVG